MTTIQQHLVARTGKSHLAHGIVMAVVITIVLAPATVSLSPTSLGAVPSTPGQESVAAATRASDAPVMPESLGYLVFDWSSADGGVPGFAPMAGNSITRAN
jgi:hypothetical protein